MIYGIAVNLVSFWRYQYVSRSFVALFELIMYTWILKELILVDLNCSNLFSREKGIQNFVYFFHRCQ